MIRFLLFITIITLWQRVLAQPIEYTPFSNLTSSDALISKFEASLSIKLRSIEGKNKKDISKFYEQSQEQLISQIEDGDFLEYDPLNAILERTLNNIKQGTPEVKSPQALLISKSGVPNAYVTPNNVIILNLGLIRRLSNESDFAFVIGHELAHIQLNHLEKRIERYFSDISKDRKKKLTEDIKRNQLDEVLSIYYDEYSHSMEDEKSADSLSVILLSKTNYNPSCYERTLRILDEADKPKYDKLPDLEYHFDFISFPYKNRWEVVRKAALSNNKGSNLIFNRDSLKTHPDISTRIAQLHSLIEMIEYEDRPSNSMSELLQYQIDFEMMNSAIVKKDFTSGLILVLQLLEQYPDDQYLRRRLCELLIEIYKARKDHEFGKYVSTFTNRPWKAKYIAFLNNIRLSEISKICLNYYKENIQFDRGREDDFLLAWEIASINNTDDLKAKIKTEYETRFPNGKYSQKFTNK